MLMQVRGGQDFLLAEQRWRRRFGGSLPFRVLMFMFATVFCPLSVLMIVVAPLSATRSGDSVSLGQLVGLALGGVLLLALSALCWTLARGVVTIDERGVALTRFGRKRRWTWSQLDGVEIGCTYDDDVGMRYWPRLVLSSGERVDLHSVSSANRHVTSEALRTATAIRRGLLVYRRATNV